MKLKKWHITGRVVGGKYLGEVKARTREEATEKGWDLAGVHLCHVCSKQVEDAEVDEIEATCDDDEEGEVKP